MDALYERRYREVLESRFNAALEAWRSGDRAALSQLEDALATMHAVRFGIPKSSLRQLWALNASNLPRRAV